MEALDWQRNREMWVRILEKRTGEGVEAWKRRIEQERLRDEPSLRAWLKEKNVTGYAQTLLVMERFGYPDFLVATAAQLVDAQYAGRPHLRPILDAILRTAKSLGDVTIQARKTYVSLVGPRRTFARVQAATRYRVDLGLRLEGRRPGGRLRSSKIHPTMKLQVMLAGVDEVDAEVVKWLTRAYEQSR